MSFQISQSAIQHCVRLRVMTLQTAVELSIEIHVVGRSMYNPSNPHEYHNGMNAN